MSARMPKPTHAFGLLSVAALAVVLVSAVAGVEALQSAGGPQAGAVQVPVAISRVTPVYPDDALKARVEGIVLLSATVSETGRVTEVKGLRGPSPSLIEAARAAVPQWRYEPARLNGVAISTTITVSINFHFPESVFDFTQEQREGGSPASTLASAGLPRASGGTATKLPPLRLESTNWFCTVKLSERREFDGFIQFRRDNTVKLVEVVRRNWPDTDYGAGGTSRPIMWPVLYPGYNGEEEMATLRNPNEPGNAGDRWASTTEEARFFTTTVGQVYRLRAKGGQLFGTIHSPEERSAERYYNDFTGYAVFDVGFKELAFGSIECSPTRAWMQR